MRCASGPAIRVLVANHSAIESELLAEVLGKDRRFLAVGWATSYADIHSLAVEHQPEVLLITLALDDEPNAGLDVLADFRTSHPNLKTVVLLESLGPEIVVQSFRLGARGVFSKNLSLKALAKCIRCVHEGQIWATNQELGFVLDALAMAPAARPSRTGSPNQLSGRELEIVNSVAAGFPMSKSRNV